jgi:hypothetical protein
LSMCLLVNGDPHDRVATDRSGFNPQIVNLG